VTDQLPNIKVEPGQPRLFSESHPQDNSDHSFEEKLKLERARLGLLFSPFSQLETLFFSSFSAADRNPQAGLNSFPAQPPMPASLPAQDEGFNSHQFTSAPGGQLFDYFPSPPFNQKLLQQLLTQTGWLTPNLLTQPFFLQAFSEGKLLPKFDLQALIDQIAEQVKLLKNKERTEFSLLLKPPELGEIFLTLTSRLGMISILIQANPETKKLIEAQREDLERSLKKAKIRFKNLTIREVEKNV
jgi:flagellar hook-length control protein FliK